MTMVEAVGWVLLHFIWQGLAIAIALAALLALTSAAQATLRYILACGALAAMLVAAIATTANVMTTLAATGAPRAGGMRKPAASSPVTVTMDDATRGGPLLEDKTPLRAIGSPATSLWTRTQPIVDAAMPWLVAAWAIGVLVLSIRLVGGWWRTRTLRVDGVAPVPAWCEAQLAALSRRLRIARPVAIVSSVRVAVPLVLGHVKPVIVLPGAVLAGLSPEQLDAILAHELAHVRRHDYLVNLAQTVVETLLFYHPAVWWVSRQVREAREHCCDDLAVTVCRSREGYVQALLGLEELRLEELRLDELTRPAELLALGATDGSLLGRARRLLKQRDGQAASPRLVAGIIALFVVAVAIAGVSSASEEAAATPVTATTPGASALATPEPPEARSEIEQPSPLAVVAAPDTTGPLATRWAWADRAARDARRARYWIGYSIMPVRTLPAYVYMDRSSTILGDRMSFGGHTFSSKPSGLRFPGRPLTVPGSDRELKLLFAFDASRGTPALTAFHGSTVSLPVDTKDLPVYWLGSGDAAQSLEQVDRLYGRAATINLQNDLIAAAGVHDASPAVVAWLERRIASDDADALRADAAEWIAWHPIAASVTALDRTARGDRSTRVRQEAAEAMGDLAMPEAAPALIALARTLDDMNARREAVEALGERSEPEARDALASIARQDQNLDIQREAVETLGDLSDGRGTATLIELARTHPQIDVRREAIETLGDAEPTDALLRLLKGFADEDQNADVQQEAIDTLAGLDHPNALPTLTELARTHPRASVRREAVEALADRASDDGQPSADRSKILDLFTALAKDDRDVEVQIEATETLGEIAGPEAVKRLRDLIDTHPDERVRVEAVESLGDHGSSDGVAKILKAIAMADKSERVRDEAIETLGDLPDGDGIDALIEIAREHPDTKIQRSALETLLDIDHPRARAAFKLQKVTGR